MARSERAKSRLLSYLQDQVSEPWTLVIPYAILARPYIHCIFPISILILTGPTSFPAARGRSLAPCPLTGVLLPRSHASLLPTSLLDQAKSPAPGMPIFGCEHVQMLLSQSQDTTNQSVHHYKMILHVDSRSGTLYCQICDDLVWDPTLEDLRVRKMGTGTFSNRKRKHDELFAESLKDNPLYISTNTTTASCKANGLRGIYNAGATCYQNVVLQSFLHNPLLRNFYLSDGHQSTDCSLGNCLSCAMDDMFQDFYAVENTNGFTAASILSGFWISEKKAFENLVTTKEQDAHEFFQFLAEELHERNGDGKPPEIGSEHSCNCIIHQTFYGKLQSTTTCQNCGGVTNAVQSFLDLSLGLDNLAQRRARKTGQKQPSLTLQECLDEEPGEIQASNGFPMSSPSSSRRAVAIRVQARTPRQGSVQN
ncbi:ubiquitin carboxyl-terminal hydrolase 8 like protein [Verticillium longisporum]|uniref:ubiquitinyl hydrolase 1 n=1 Tax=Verticillium longisporum TaxID=100787 RepID=A0A8I2ZPN2_VERLO|nr:ubiquitin carboxyl-terminal hydrolase 8 like protein [Verticillium longisporum]